MNKFSWHLKACIGILAASSRVALGQYGVGDTVNLNAVDPNCFISTTPVNVVCQASGVVTIVRDNMPGYPHPITPIGFRNEIRRELGEFNYSCSPLPEDNYDTSITTAAEYWNTLNIPPDRAAEARFLAESASGFSVTRVADEGLSELAFHTPNPFNIRGFIRDRPLTTGSLSLPACSDLEYVTSLPTSVYRLARI